MSQEVKKKTVSYSQFSNWWTCPYKWKLDYIDKLKKFEESVHMSFGTAVHEAIQEYLKLLFKESEEKADALDKIAVMTTTFKRELDHKKIIHTPQEFDSFIEDGKKILNEFCSKATRIQHYSQHKFELLGIEDSLNEEILNNVVLTGKLDIVLKEKQTGNIKILDLKTSSRGWTKYEKEDFTKTSQLVLYKALYSKKYNIPLNKINIEFVILRRTLYENCNYEQSHLQFFKPNSYQNDVIEVIQEFKKFVSACFTESGEHKKDAEYEKIPGPRKKNCKYCQYIKIGKCDGIGSSK